MGRLLIRRTTMVDYTKQNKNFSVEALLDPKKLQEVKNQFQVDYTPMWHFLDNMERKVGGFDKIPLKQVLEAVFEFATIQVSLDKADMQTRIDSLNDNNLKWHTRAMDLEKELETLKQKLQKNPATNENS